MKTLIFVIVIAIALKLFLDFAKKQKNGERTGKAGNGIRDAECFSKNVLSEAEQTLFFRIREAFPDNVVLAQVAMNALVGIRKNPNWQRQFNSIGMKYVDFVLCKRDFTIRAVIELDDASHEKYERWKSDDIKNVAFAKAGIPLIRFKASEMPSVKEIQRRLSDT